MESSSPEDVVLTRPTWEPYDVVAGTDPSPPRSGWLVRVAVVLVVALVGGVVWGMSRNSEPSADAALAEAQAFVGDTSSYRFEITMASRISTGDPAGAGAEASSRSVTSGAVGGPDRWTMTSEYADVMLDEPYSDTVIRSGDDVYVQVSPMGSGPRVAGPPWLRLTAEEATATTDDLAESLSWMEDEGGTGVDLLADGLAVETLLSAYLLDVESAPTSIVRLVGDAATPAVEERLAEGGVRLRVTLPPVAAIADMVERASDQELPPVDVLLDLDRDGRPTTARFTAALGAASAELVVDFDGWGSDIEVTAPTEDEVDQTPWLQEEALRALDAGMLLVPTSTPEPLDLTGISVYEGTGDDWDCTSLDLSYQDPAGLQVDDLSEAELSVLPYLYLAVYPAGCWLADDPEPFDRTLGGHPARQVDGYWEIQIGAAVIELDTSLEDDALDAFAASIAPTSADALIADSSEALEATSAW